MSNIYFSPKNMGFYVQENELPSDALKVSARTEEFLRRAIIWGASEFEFSEKQISVTYPEYLKEYVTEHHAPFIFEKDNKS